MLGEVRGFAVVVAVVAVVVFVVASASASSRQAVVQQISLSVASPSMICSSLGINPASPQPKPRFPPKSSHYFVSTHLFSSLRASTIKHLQTSPLQNKVKASLRSTKS